MNVPMVNSRFDWSAKAAAKKRMPYATISRLPIRTRA
jgi:hypothetical protein